jgi:peptidoglycan hydrolase-like protein with peptidoglycan-binding domain
MKRITESGLKNLAGRLRTILAEALTPEEDAKFKELDTKRQTLSTSFNAIKKQYDADPTANANLKVPLAELEKQLMSIGSEISALEAKRDGTPNTQGGEKKGWAAGTLGLGSRGPEVKALQDKLIAAGLLDPTTGPGGKPANDGIFGPNTQHAVQNLQDRLGVSKDGIYGPNTQRALAAKPEAIAPEKTTIVAPPVNAVSGATTNVNIDSVIQHAVTDVKTMASTPLNAIPRFGVAINPTSGQIFYGDAGNDSGTISPKGYPFKWLQPGGPAESVKDGDRIRASGLKIVDKNGYAYIDPTKLATLGQASAPTPVSEAPAPAPSTLQTTESIGFQPDELNRIVSLVHHR